MTKSIHFLILWTMLALAVAIPMAHAAKPELTGTYKVVGSNSCEINNVGFSAYPDLFALGPVFQVINTWESKMQFLANGQVIDVSSGQYAIPGFGQPVGTFETVCQYTSTANPDGSFTLTGECNDNVLSGVAKRSSRRSRIPLVNAIGMTATFFHFRIGVPIWVILPVPSMRFITRGFNFSNGISACRLALNSCSRATKSPLLISSQIRFPIRVKRIVICLSCSCSCAKPEPAKKSVSKTAQSIRRDFLLYVIR